MATVITDSASLVTIIISSLLLITAFSFANDITIDIRNEDGLSSRSVKNQPKDNETTIRKPVYSNNDNNHYWYGVAKNYFLKFKRTIYVVLKRAQPNETDETIEFESWTLSVIAMIMITIIFGCCFIPLIICLACKIFGFFACTSCRVCFRTA